jgi:hypothetical protein
MHVKGVLNMGLGLLVSWVIMSCPVSVGAPQSRAMSTPPVESARLESPRVARLFGEMAQELIGGADVSDAQRECAQVFLRAARELDRSNDAIQRMLLDVAVRWPERDYSASIHAWLEHNDALSDDVGLVKDSIDYLDSRLRSRVEREQFLEAVLGRVHERNVLLDSHLFTELGLLMIEQNKKNEAWRYLQQGYKVHLYNKLAFAKLAELLPDQITAEMYFEHLRYAMLANPLDIDAALAFAQYAEQLELYALAVGGYDYCVALYYYLYPGQPLPQYIYLPWAISNYNVKGKKHRVTQIATKVRESGEFDIFLEGLAGRAAHQLGDESTAQRIFTVAEQRATQLHFKGPDKADLNESSQGITHVVGPKQFAWFYCFALPDKDKALEWANLTYSTDPNSEASASILAYALVLNEQWKWAKLSAEKHDRQIALLALAMIQLNEGEKEKAINTLKRAVSKDPGSLVAERAREVLARNGSRYETPAKVTEVLTSLAERFGELIVPRFTPPEKLVSLRFEVLEKTIAYGRGVEAVITLVNQSDEALLVSESGLIRGAIRIDARSQGDVTASWKNLMVRKLFADSLIQPGHGLSKRVRLDVGALGRLMHAHPQANMDIDFTLYLDPVETDPNTVQNRITGINPVVVQVKRPAVQISEQFLNQQYNDIALGDLTRRMETAELFIGLLKELQEVVRRGAALYNIQYADWMPGRLKSALTSDSGLLLYRIGSEWEAKAQVLTTMRDLELDAGLTEAVARHLNNPRWPVRLVALYLLAQSQGRAFNDVLDHQTKYDLNRLVRDMAQVLKSGAERITLSGLK